MKKLFYIPFMMVMALSVVACIAPEEKQEIDKSFYVWPKPPEKARIKFVDAIACDVNVREVTAQEKMFGSIAEFCFIKPQDVIVDKRGTVHVSDPVKGTMANFNLEDKTFQKAENSLLPMPHGLGYDYKNDLLGVVDIAQKSVTIIQLPSGKVKLVLKQKENQFKKPLDVDFDPERERIYVLDIKRSSILVFDYNGKKIKEFGQAGLEPGSLFAPVQIDVDRHGNIYVVESFNFRFQVFDPDGNSIATVGQHGSVQGDFARPKGIAVDSEDRAYITDAAFGNFQVMDKDGNFYIAVGRNGTRFPARFSIPQGIFVDHRDRIIVVDQDNRRVQIFQLLTDKYYEEQAGEASSSEEPEVPEEEEFTVEPVKDPEADESWEVMEPATEVDESAVEELAPVAEEITTPEDQPEEPIISEEIPAEESPAEAETSPEQ